MDANLFVAAVTMGGLGLIFATVLAVADRKLHVDESPLMVHVLEILPEANCGACGAAGCHDFAVKLLEGKMEVAGCPIGGQAVANKLAQLLQVEAVQTEPLVARLMCNGGVSKAVQKQAAYIGPTECRVQAIVSGGRKLCFFGCLGGGDCVSACKVDAIQMNAEQLPMIDETICTGCGLCVQVCPVKVIELHPTSREVFVFCRNQDNPQTARQVCSAACIGCGICARASDGAIVMQNNLAVIDYQKIKMEQIPLHRCKTRAIQRIDRTT